jgi:hypothetical protein
MGQIGADGLSDHSENRLGLSAILHATPRNAMPTHARRLSPELALCASLLLSMPAAGRPNQQAFIHPFGELRAYRQDWLVVCEERGKGVCRMVNMNLNSKAEPFFGHSELTLYPKGQYPLPSGYSEYGGAAFISFFKRDMPALQCPVSFAVDGKPVAELQPHQNIFDNTSEAKGQKPIAMETYWLEGPTAERLFGPLRRGRWLDIGYCEDGANSTLSD